MKSISATRASERCWPGWDIWPVSAPRNPALPFSDRHSMQALSPCTWGSIFQFSKSISSIALLVCGLLLTSANLWFTAARSLIPLAVNGRLTSKEKRPEKHPGNDDVYLLKVAGRRIVQVDEPIYDRVAEGAELK